MGQAQWTDHVRRNIRLRFCARRKPETERENQTNKRCKDNDGHCDRSSVRFRWIDLVKRTKKRIDHRKQKAPNISANPATTPKLNPANAGFAKPPTGSPF